MEKTPRQNRIREVLGKLYDQHPPHFRENLRRFEEDPSSRVFAPLAEAYRRMGQLNQAISICKTGLEHHPDFHGGRVALAKCYLDKKDYEAAKLELETVVRGVPENLLAQRLLGETYLSLGNKERGLHALKMALILSPGDVVLSEKIHALETDPEAVPEEIKEAKTLTQENDSEDVVEIVGVPIENQTPPTEELLATDVEEFVVPLNLVEDEVPSDPKVRSEINSLLGVTDGDAEDESFKIQHVSHIFTEPEKENHKEITTETLGDLYYSQEQYQKSLEIFEKISNYRSTPELQSKINLCRERLGVDQSTLNRHKKIEVLRGLLKRAQEQKVPA